MTGMDDAIARITRRDYRVAIIGLGYVGWPLALTACRAGFPVLGFDISADRISRLRRGHVPQPHFGPEIARDAEAANRLDLTTDMSRLAEADAIIIAVPTPLGPHREPDLSFVEATARSVTATLKPGQLVVLESTSWPGTTDEVVRPILESAGMVSGRDFHLAFSPEREDPGNATHSTATIPKVVGADDANALYLARSLYDALVVKTVAVSSTATAEAVKLTENIFRAVNVALMNELKVVYERMGLDIWEVIEAAKTKPFGFMPFYPGPGLGGHCIPIDPFYLTWKAREYGVATRFIELAGEINTAMPHYVVDRLAEALDRASGRGLHGARILVAGVAYKKNVSDTRESPALAIMDLLKTRLAIVDYHDPLVSELPPTRKHPGLTGRRSVALTPEAVASYDAVLIATDHDELDVRVLGEFAKLVIDTRNCCARAGLAGSHIGRA